MKITREMCFTEADCYTDMLYIVTRSLGVNPVQTTLSESIEKLVRLGYGYSEAVYLERTYLEQFLNRELVRREAVHA